ncbi:MAG: hypothetical protein RLZZ630_1495 [Bacteroidota bacterium]|jgi:hypothetical protein
MILKSNLSDFDSKRSFSMVKEGFFGIKIDLNMQNSNLIINVIQGIVY